MVFPDFRWERSPLSLVILAHFFLLAARCSLLSLSPSWHRTAGVDGCFYWLATLVVWRCDLLLWEGRFDFWLGLALALGQIGYIVPYSVPYRDSVVTGVSTRNTYIHRF